MQRPAALNLEIWGFWSFSVPAADTSEPLAPRKVSGSAAPPAHGEGCGSGPSQLPFRATQGEVPGSFQPILSCTTVLKIYFQTLYFILNFIIP